MEDVESGESCNRRKVGLLSLIPVAFFWVSGGIYGNEVLLQAAPPFYIMLSFVVFPLVYSLPLALITAELATALPQDGGAAVWAQEAFGKRLGGHVAYWMWVSSVIDSASYPSLASDVLSEVVSLPACARQVTAVCFAVCIVIVKLRGMRDTVVMSALLMAIAILPVILYVCLGMRLFRLQAILSTDGSCNWRLLVSWMTWTFSGFVSIGSVAGQVDRPQHVYPKLVVILIALIIAQNVVPMCIFVSQDSVMNNYKIGYFATLAGQAVDPALRNIFVVASCVCQLGMCNAMSLVADRSLAFLLEPQLAVFLSTTAFSRSWCFSVHSQSGIRPVYTLLNGCLMCLLSRQSLQVLVSSEMFLFTLTSLTLLAAFAHLKRTRPDLPRAYVFPGRFAGALLLTLVPSIVTVLQITLFISEATEGDEAMSQLISIGCVLIFGVVVQATFTLYLNKRGPHRA